MEDIQFIVLAIWTLLAFLFALVVRKQSIEKAFLELLISVDGRVAVGLHRYYESATDRQKKAVRALLSAGDFLADLTATEDDDALMASIHAKVIGELHNA